MASDRNLILGAAAAAPKFNTAFGNIVDKEVKEFTDRVEKEAKEKQARAEAISLDTANFLEGLPANPNVELIDESLRPNVESFLAKTRMNLAGLYRTRRGDTVTYAPGTEAYDKITREIEAGTRAINNVLNQLKIHQANSADYMKEQASISQHWKEENLDMFADMKNIYLDKTYGSTIDANGNITINGKYKINEWNSNENIKKLDWNVKENKYSIIYSNVMLDTKNRNKTRKISKDDGIGYNIYNQFANYFLNQTDGGKDAITSLVMDNPNFEGFNILQAEDNVGELKNLIKQGKYNEAIQSVAKSNALRVIKEQNLAYDTYNKPRNTKTASQIATEKSDQALIDQMKLINEKVKGFEDSINADTEEPKILTIDSATKPITIPKKRMSVDDKENFILKSYNALLGRSGSIQKSEDGKYYLIDRRESFGGQMFKQPIDINNPSELLSTAALFLGSKNMVALLGEDAPGGLPTNQ